MTLGFGRIWLTAFCSLLLLGSFPAQSQGSPILVEDVVRFAVIGDPWTLGDVDGDLSRVASYSPDGRYAAVIVRRGNPERGTFDGSLLLYSLADLARRPQPVVLAELSSSSDAQPLAFVRWLSDNRTLIFAGTREGGVPQVYRIDIETRVIDQLTEESSVLAGYDITTSGHRLLVAATPLNVPLASDPHCRLSACRVDGSNLWDVERGRGTGSSSLVVRDIGTGAIRRVDNPEMHDPTIRRCLDAGVDGGMSPDGHYTLRICEHGQPVASWWQDYRATPRLRECGRTWNRGCGRRYFLINLDNGSTAPLSEAPAVYRQPPPLWIDNGRSLLVIGAVEPLTNVSADERAIRSASLSLLVFDPRTGASSRVARLDPRIAAIRNATWHQGTQTLIIQSVDDRGSPLPRTQFSRRGGRWTQTNVPEARAVAGDAPGILLSVEQSLVERPRLVATDRRSGARTVILDPNPWLVDRQLGRVEAIRWQSSDGHVWHGGLYYPPDYRTGARYPLVIQTHGFDERRFSMDGLSRNYAGRALAAQGMLVLQVEENFAGTIGTPAEYRTIQSGWEAAIDHLDRLGLADRSRVGIQGWSRTGPQAGYALTQSAYPFAAAALTETADFGWAWYLNAGASHGQDALYGSAPFGPGLEPWLEAAPTFNMERVRTPTFLWGGGAASILWDWYAGLTRLGRPVEYWVAPEAAHDLMRTSQRLLLSQLLVDWFRFWLTGAERTVVVRWRDETQASLAEQNARWRQLRRQQQAVLQQPRPPLLDWAATPRAE